MPARKTDDDLSRRAQTFYDEARYDLLFALYVEVLSQRLDENTSAFASLDVQQLVAADGAAQLAPMFGAAGAAESLLVALVVACRRAGQHEEADYYSLKRVQLALDFGSIAEARALIDELEPVLGRLEDIDLTHPGFASWETEHAWPSAGAMRPVLLSNTYLVFGQLLATLGQYRDAVTALTRGVTHASQCTPNVAPRLMTRLGLIRAGAWLESGEFQRAEDALASLCADCKGHPEHYVEWLELAAKLHMLQGQYGAAVRRLEEVLATVRGASFAAAEAAVLVNLAHVQIALNQTAQAAELLTQARGAAKSSGDRNSETRAIYLLGLARARGQSLAADIPIGPSVSEMWESTWREIAASSGNPLDAPDSLPQPRSFLALYEDRALGVQCRLAQFDARGARALLAAIAEVFAATDSPLISMRLTALSGIVAYYEHDYGSAETLLSAAAEASRRMAALPDLWQSLRFLSWAKSRLGRADPSLDAEAEVLLDAMAESLGGVERGIFLLNKWTADEESLARRVDHVARLQSLAARAPWYLRALRTSAARRAARDVTFRIDRFKAVVSERTTGAAGERPDVAGAPARRTMRQPRTRATVSFLALPDRLVIVCLRGGDSRVAVTGVTRVQLRQLVRELHEAVRAHVQSAAAGDAEVAAAAGRLEDAARKLATVTQLDAMARDLPRAVKELVIVPDDVLHGVPFAVLRCDGRYLVERFALTVAFEAAPMRRPTALRPLDALLVGASIGADDLPELPGVPRELDRVRAMAAAYGWNVTTLLDAEATKTRVVERMKQSTVVHVACHGVFEADRPDRSGLLLFPAAHVGDRLTLREIAALDLRHVRHVTLSSCWSADNFVLPGRWILSLPETLIRAGAHSVVGSLWPVSDDTSTRFMEAFYRDLGASGAAEALRRAQLAMLSAAEPYDGEHRSPLYWAGFVAYGETTPLRG